MSRIIDIYHGETVKDWDELKKDCPFLIHKATQGTSHIDSHYESVIKQCEKRGIPYWLYTFLNKGNELNQAKYLVKVTKDKVGKYFVGYILDVERDNTAAGIQSALDYMKKLDVKLMLYTNFADYITYRKVIQGRGNNCAWWEARYGKNNGSYDSAHPSHSGVDMHQYTDKGKVPYISSGGVDLNRITGDGKTKKWFTQPLKEIEEEQKTKKAYTGQFPTLPKRGYFRLNDGITVLLSDKDKAQIRLLQLFLNWCMWSGLASDGQYGPKTRDAVKAFQKEYGLKADGLFGEKSLKAAKAVKL